MQRGADLCGGQGRDGGAAGAAAAAGPLSFGSGTAALRALGEKDLAAAHALSAGFGWPHRLEDWRFMLARGEGVAAADGGLLGTGLLGTGLWWTYGAAGGALGMIQVSPTAQGRGLGRRIFARVLEGLGARSVLLHATEAGLPLYRSFGFVTEGVVRQHQGVPAGLAAEAAVRAVRAEDAARLTELDRAATGMDRAALLEALLEAAEGVSDEGGFAVLRRFGRGFVVGPVIAPDAAAARRLIAGCLAARPGAFMRVDVPEESGLGSWLETLGLGDAGPAIRMVRGARFEGPGAFALASQAFG